jgi:hypothetical protein
MIVITVYLMNLLMDMLAGIPWKPLREKLEGFFVHPLIVMIINFGVSSIIMIFVGKGMIGGVSNLLASVVAAIIFNPVRNIILKNREKREKMKPKRKYWD